MPLSKDIIKKIASQSAPSHDELVQWAKRAAALERMAVSTKRLLNRAAELFYDIQFGKSEAPGIIKEEWCAGWVNSLGEEIAEPEEDKREIEDYLLDLLKSYHIHHKMTRAQLADALIENAWANMELGTDGEAALFEVIIRLREEKE